MPVVRLIHFNRGLLRHPLATCWVLLPRRSSPQRPVLLLLLLWAGLLRHLLRHSCRLMPLALDRGLCRQLLLSACSCLV